MYCFTYIGYRDMYKRKIHIFKMRLNSEEDKMEKGNLKGTSSKCKVFS